MKNNFVMTSDLITALSVLMAKYGDVPVLLADSNSEKAMVPLEEAHCIEVVDVMSSDQHQPEKCIMLANFTLCDNDGNSMGCGLSEL